MRQAVLYAIMFLFFSTLLVQCVATQQDVEYTNVKVRKMDDKVADINKEIEELKKQTVQDVQSRQAQTSDRLDFQQSEILRLQSEIEESNFIIRQVQEENKELKKLLLNRMDTSEQARFEDINRLNDRLALTEEQLLKATERVAAAESEIRAIKQARSLEASQRAREAAEQAREAERKARMAAEQESIQESVKIKEILPEAYKVDVSSQNITDVSVEEKEAEIKTAAVPAPPPAAASSYDRGMDLFRQKRYRDAYNSFAAYLDENPAGSQAVNARYHAAESLYEEKDYELAILEYQKVIVEHPKHALAPKALYKQGLAFEKIGDPETARIVYNKLVDTYPGSESVTSAKSRLKSLKK